MNQTEEQNRKMKDDYRSHFFSDIKAGRKAEEAERKYMGEWERQIAGLGHAMRNFDPQASRKLAGNMRRTALAVLDEREAELEQDCAAAFGKYGIDASNPTRESISRLPEGDRRALAREAKEIHDAREAVRNTGRDGFDYIRGLQQRIGRIAEGVRELYSEAAADPDLRDSHLEGGIKDFCGFAEEVQGYISRVLDGDRKVSAAVDMLAKASRYGEAYSLDGVPDRAGFRNMVDSCRSMARKVWEEAVSNSMYRA